MKIPKIWREKPGVISEGQAWVCQHDCWLYAHDTLGELLWVLFTEWKQDKHLVG